MSFIQKNKRKIIIITILLLMGIAFLLTWLQRSVWHNNTDTNSKVYPLKFSLKDTFFYSDKTVIEGSRRWEFGDGNISLADSGYYQYRRPGYYQVKLSINNNYIKVFDIRVMDTTTIGRIEDSLTVIEGPATAMQFENIVFRAHTKNAKFFSWKFGESNSVDAKEQMVIYAYQLPGDYVVSLYTDEMQYPVTQKIHILPSYKLMSDSVSLDDMYKKIDDDFKYHLQQIADGKNFNEHYNYLLKKYLCNNENAIMKVNNNKINNFFYYCSGLQFDKKSIIQSVKTGFDDKQNCVTKVEVVQTK
jgi:hypothetical protein